MPEKTDSSIEYDEEALAELTVDQIMRKATNVSLKNFTRSNNTPLPNRSNDENIENTYQMANKPNQPQKQSKEKIYLDAAQSSSIRKPVSSSYLENDIENPTYYASRRSPKPLNIIISEQSDTESNIGRNADFPIRVYDERSVSPSRKISCSLPAYKQCSTFPVNDQRQGFKFAEQPPLQGEDMSYCKVYQDPSCRNEQNAKYALREISNILQGICFESGISSANYETDDDQYIRIPLDNKRNKKLKDKSRGRINNTSNKQPTRPKPMYTQQPSRPSVTFGEQTGGRNTMPQVNQPARRTSGRNMALRQQPRLSDVDTRRATMYADPDLEDFDMYPDEFEPEDMMPLAHVGEPKEMMPSAYAGDPPRNRRALEEAISYFSKKCTADFLIAEAENLKRMEKCVKSQELKKPLDALKARCEECPEQCNSSNCTKVIIGLLIVVIILLGLIVTYLYLTKPPWKQENMICTNPSNEKTQDKTSSCRIM